jgi:hypothetical protein
MVSFAEFFEPVVCQPEIPIHHIEVSRFDLVFIKQGQNPSVHERRPEFFHHVQRQGISPIFNYNFPNQ